MEGVKKLEYLSLVSKVCTELESHVGCADKMLAEFIMELAQQSESVDAFSKLLKQKVAEILEYFVPTLLTIIHAILPPKNEKAAKCGEEAAAFRALSIPDDKQRVKELEKELKIRPRPPRAPRHGGRGLEEEDGKEDGGEKVHRSRGRKHREYDEGPKFRDSEKVEGFRVRDEDRDAAGGRGRWRGGMVETGTATKMGEKAMAGIGMTMSMERDAAHHGPRDSDDQFKDDDVEHEGYGHQ